MGRDKPSQQKAELRRELSDNTGKAADKAEKKQKSKEKKLKGQTKQKR